MNIVKCLHNLSSDKPANFISEILHEKHTFLSLHGNLKSTSNPFWNKSLELFLKKNKGAREPNLKTPAFANSYYSL